MLQNLGDQIRIKLPNGNQSVWSVMYTDICTEWNYNFIHKLQPCYMFQQQIFILIETSVSAVLYFNVNTCAIDMLYIPLYQHVPEDGN